MWRRRSWTAQYPVDREGFVIVVEPQRVFLVGNELFRTYWVVGEFLRRYLDIR